MIVPTEAREKHVAYEKAKIARWFSKDSAQMAVYHSRDGSQYPVTRDEQDRWLYEGYEIAEKIQEPIKLKNAIPYVLVVTGVFISPAFEPIFPDRFAFLIGTIIAVMMQIIALLGLLLLFIVPIIKFSWKSDIKILRKSIEKKVGYRTAVFSNKKRHNAFRFLIRTGEAIFFTGYYYYVITAAPWIGSIWSILSMIIGISIIIYFDQLTKSLDRAHVRQTGKWFRRQQVQ